MRVLIYATLLALLGACSRTSPPANSLESLRGQWVVVNYWAKWCKPCIEEIPELNHLDAGYDDIAVLGVNYDGLAGEELAVQERDLGVQFPTIADPAAQLGIPRPVVLPTSVLIGPGGEVRATLIGPQTEESLLEAIHGKRS